MELVWQPDVVLMNNADGILDVIYKPNVVVTHDGSVLWMPPAVYQSTCTLELKDFPFDVQVCPMKFASWTFPADQVLVKAIYCSIMHCIRHSAVCTIRSSLLLMGWISKTLSSPEHGTLNREEGSSATTRMRVPQPQTQLFI